MKKTKHELHKQRSDANMAALNVATAALVETLPGGIAEWDRRDRRETHFLYAVLVWVAGKTGQKLWQEAIAFAEKSQKEADERDAARAARGAQ